jgi:predicted alpha/beta superfamily hydrolase
LFDTYIAFDPSLWWNNQALLNGVAERLKARPKMDKTLYIASSSEAIVEASERFAEIAGKSAVSRFRFIYEQFPNEKHSTIYHPAALKAFRILFKPIASK